MKRTRRISLMCAACLAFTGSLSVNAYSGGDSLIAEAAEYTQMKEGCLTYNIYSTYATVSSYDNTQAEVVIPDTMNGLPVIGIEASAFEMQPISQLFGIPLTDYVLETVTLPKGLISIGSHAFQNNLNLKAVEIPDTVTDMRTEAFRGCSSLSSVKLSANLAMIPDSCFAECTELSAITFPSSVKEIGSSAFFNTGLIEVVIPGTVTRLYGTAFSECRNLKSVVMEEGVAEMSSAFCKCPILESAVIPSTAILKYSASGGLFSDCPELKTVTIKEGAAFASILGDNNIFANCTSLKSIHLPDSFTKISSGAFSGCTALTDVNIPETCVLIGSFAFLGCSSLTKIVIPKSVEKIEYNAFKDCARLENLTFEGASCNIKAATGSSGGNTTVCNYTLNGKTYYNGVIYGLENSTAQKFASDCGYTFKLLGSETPARLKGDLDGDGEITAIDAQNTLIAYVEALTNDGETGLTEVQFKACDVDGDGEITAADAQYILIYYTENNVAGNPITWDAIVKK